MAHATAMPTTVAVRVSTGPVPATAATTASVTTTTACVTATLASLDETAVRYNAQTIAMATECVTMRQPNVFATKSSRESTALTATALTTAVSMANASTAHVGVIANGVELTAQWHTVPTRALSTAHVTTTLKRPNSALMSGASARRSGLAKTAPSLPVVPSVLKLVACVIEVHSLSLNQSRLRD